MNTPTPTPRTDAAWSATFDGEQISAGKTARTLRECSQRLEAELAALTAERDQLRTEVERLKAIGSWAHTCIHHTDEQRAKAKGCPVCAAAELAGLRAHCESETKWAAHYLARSIAEKARAERAEDNLAALEQCHDDNCRGVVKIAAELTAERARLDWVFRNCKITADGYPIHDREDLGAAMKEHTK